MMKYIIFILYFCLSGCTYKVAIPEQNKPIFDQEKVINQLYTGMSKIDVIQILGEPLYTEANTVNTQCLIYPLTIDQKQNFYLLFSKNILQVYSRQQNCMKLLQNIEG